MSFANNLKQAMAEREMNQKELSEAIDMGKSSVSQYLSGRSVPRQEVQERIADVLECTVEWLNSGSSQGGPECGLKNVSIAEAARQLGKSEQFIRVALQTGKAPFGFAAKNKSKWSYHISPKKLAEYIEDSTNA